MFAMEGGGAGPDGLSDHMEADDSDGSWRGGMGDNPEGISKFVFCFMLNRFFLISERVRDPIGDGWGWRRDSLPT